MESLLDRFCRYVRIDTTAVEETEAYPSSPGQLELGRMLADEMKELGLRDVAATPEGVVYGTIPANVEGAPRIAWIAHMDTSPEASGKGVRPIVHHDYAGGEIQLPGDPTRIIRPAESPGLDAARGMTLITSDGTTLLGADDKAGIAVIMTAAARLLAEPHHPRGEIRVVFTCDEEVGRGVDKVDLSRIGACVAYTLDGEASGIIENETFSADQATVVIRGRNIHPGLAKDRMINAIRLAAEFLAKLPPEAAPETTSGRQGFLHPYAVEGSVAEAKIKMILRSFVTERLEDQAVLLRRNAEEVERAHPGAYVEVHLRRQYRNMLEALAAEPRAVGLAEEAMRVSGLEPRLEAVRGGTDGSRLSEMGLPTPNLGVGMHNYHSPLEYACLQEMERTVDVLLNLAALWSKESSPQS